MGVLTSDTPAIHRHGAHRLHLFRIAIHTIITTTHTAIAVISAATHV